MKTKKQMAIVIFAALQDTSLENAERQAERGHGEFQLIMKHKMPSIEEQYRLAVEVLAQRNITV